MFEITVTAWFSAAHQLRLCDGALEPLHGHNWRVSVTLRGPQLDDMGVLADFTRVKPWLDAALATLHDRHLNELPEFANRNPSAENVAMHVAELFDRRVAPGAALTMVEVEEAPGCIARAITDAAVLNSK